MVYPGQLNPTGSEHTSTREIIWFKQAKHLYTQLLPNNYADMPTRCHLHRSACKVPQSHACTTMTICMLSKINNLTNCFCMALKIIVNLNMSWGLDKSYPNKKFGWCGPTPTQGKKPEISGKTHVMTALIHTSQLIQQDSVSTGYTASRRHNRGCLWACKNPMSCCDKTKTGKHITTNERWIPRLQ